MHLATFELKMQLSLLLVEKRVLIEKSNLEPDIEETKWNWFQCVITEKMIEREINIQKRANEICNKLLIELLYKTDFQVFYLENLVKIVDIFSGN